MAPIIEEKKNKYSREIKPGVFVDVYDVLNAFKTGSAAVDHAVKKLLAPGKRGVKPREQDLREAIASIERAIEIENPQKTVTKPMKRRFYCKECTEGILLDIDIPDQCPRCKVDQND